MHNDQKARRKLRAILSADVKDYSILMADDESHAVQTRKSYLKIMSEYIYQNAGIVVESCGNKFMAEFRSVADAVQCAFIIQNR